MSLSLSMSLYLAVSLSLYLSVSFSLSFSLSDTHLFMKSVVIGLEREHDSFKHLHHLRVRTCARMCECVCVTFTSSPAPVCVRETEKHTHISRTLSVRVCEREDAGVCA